MKSGNEIMINDELIVKYLSGGASPEEAVALMDWMAITVNKIHFQQFESAWSATHPIKASFNKQTAWTTMETKIQHPSSGGKTRSIFSIQVFKIAASFLILVISGFWVYLRLSNDEDRKTISTTSESETILLSDSTRVTLNRNSSLDFPQLFEKNKREIHMASGEAFFTVSHDKNRPFTVHTKIADVRVIGTEFNVSLDETHVEVSVKEGRVMVFTNNDSIFLSRGTRGEVTLGGRIISGSGEAESNTWGYATHRLVFNDTPMKKVIKEIERAYPCSISVSNESIKKCHLTATFDNDSIDNIVNLISEILNLTVKRNDRIFTLEGEGCP